MYRLFIIKRLIEDIIIFPFVLTGKLVGTAGVPNYFRVPYGSGWALVGDAGYCKDPLTAQGISGAFIAAGHLTKSY